MTLNKVLAKITHVLPRRTGSEAVCVQHGRWSQIKYLYIIVFAPYADLSIVLGMLLDSSY